MSKNNEKNITYSVFKQKLTYRKYKQYFNILKKILHYSKNLFNDALYILRQNFFNNQNKEKKDRKYINYYDLCFILKDNNNYKHIQATCAQQVLKNVSEIFKSFITLKKKKIKCNIPRYLNKDGYFQLIDPEDNKRINKINDKLYYTVPMSKLFMQINNLSYKENDRIRIQIPHILENKKIRQIRIIPKYKAKYIEIHYYFEKEKDQIDPLAQSKENNNFNILSIDLGINNLTTCTIYKPYEKLKNKFKTFIIDGKKLKSYNQWYNKRIKFLKKKLNEDKNNQIHYSKQMYNITYKRNNRIYDYINKACNYIVKYCLQNNIHIIILGYNQGMKQDIDLGKKSNQKITNIPFYRLKEQLIYRCEEKNIKLIIQEESYTSKANFINNDYIFTYKKNENNKWILETINNKIELKKKNFSGIRRKGLYKTNDNIKINADVNGSLNIMRKALLNKKISNVVNEEHLICGEQIIDKKILSRLREDVKKVLDIRGGLVTPIRIKLV